MKAVFTILTILALASCVVTHRVELSGQVKVIQNTDEGIDQPLTLEFDEIISGPWTLEPGSTLTIDPEFFQPVPDDVSHVVFDPGMIDISQGAGWSVIWDDDGFIKMTADTLDEYRVPDQKPSELKVCRHKKNTIFVDGWDEYQVCLDCGHRCKL